MIEAVTFDFEVDIVDVDFAHFEGFRLATDEEKIGIHFDLSNPMEDIASKIEDAIGGGDALISTGIARLANPEASSEEIQELAQKIRARKTYFYNEIIEGLGSIEPREGFLEVFGQIRRRGLPVAIASLSPRRQAEVLLERSGIGKLFPKHLILLEDSVAPDRLKPHPDVLLEAARRMAIHPSKQLYFGDSRTDIRTGRAAGSPTVAMPPSRISPANMEALKEAGPVAVFTSWKQIDDPTLTTLLNM